MGKDLTRGGISVKQWGGAHVFTDSLTNMHFNVSPTGGVPIKSPRQGIYHFRNKFIANDFARAIKQESYLSGVLTRLGDVKSHIRPSTGVANG